MKKLITFAVVMILALSPAMTFAVDRNVNSETLTVPVTENKLLEQEIGNMNLHLDEIRDTDKLDMTSKDKKDIKKNKKGSGAIYIGGTTLLLVIIIIILLV